MRDGVAGTEADAAAYAGAKVARVADDPAGRMALLHATYERPAGTVVRHRPFRRAYRSSTR